MELRPGNYVHPGKDDVADTGRYLRILSIDLLQKQVTAKADHDTEIHTLAHTAIFPCGLDRLMEITGGLSFGAHSLLLKDGAVAIVPEDGSMMAMPHILYIHQFQNLVRSLTGEELPFNIALQDR